MGGREIPESNRTDRTQPEIQNIRTVEIRKVTRRTVADRILPEFQNIRNVEIRKVVPE